MPSRKYPQKAAHLGERHQGQTDTLLCSEPHANAVYASVLKRKGGQRLAPRATHQTLASSLSGGSGLCPAPRPPEEMKGRSSPWLCTLERCVHVNVHTAAGSDERCVKHSCPRGRERVAMPGKLEPSSLNSSGFPHCPGGGGRKAQAEYQQEPSLQTRQRAFPLLPGRVAHSVVASFISGTLLTRKIHKMTGFLKKEMRWSGDEVSQSCCSKSRGQSWN